MVNRIINGDFSGGVNDPEDRDPFGWTIINETNQYQVVADHEKLEYQEWLAFSTAGSPARSQIRQVVNDVKIGDEITFSFDYKEVGVAPGERVSFQYSIYDDLGNLVIQDIAASSDTSYETPIVSVTHSFIAERTSYTLIFFDNSANAPGRDILLDNVVFDVPCFCSGTRIETDRGHVAIENIIAGGLVRTRDHGLQPVRWIGSRDLTSADLQNAPKMRPIHIRAGALGPGIPVDDLYVSPQHRILIRSAIAQRMFGSPEVLVAAKHLCALDGIDIATDNKAVRYFHMLFDRHEVIFSNGAETESLYIGQQALKSVGPAAYEEIFALFPELQRQNPAGLPIQARPFSSGREGRRLAERHAKNNKQLVC